MQAMHQCYGADRESSREYVALNQVEPQGGAEEALIILLHLHEEDVLWLLGIFAAARPEIFAKVLSGAAASQPPRPLAIQAQWNAKNAPQGLHAQALQMHERMQSEPSRGHAPRSAPREQQAPQASAADERPHRPERRNANDSVRDVALRGHTETKRLRPDPMFKAEPGPIRDPVPSIRNGNGNVFPYPRDGNGNGNGNDASGDLPSEPVVQFSTFIYYCNEDENHIEIEIMRIGALAKPSAVNFKTRDLSAKSGVAYHSVEKRCVFEPRQDHLIITVPLIASTLWDTTVEFAVELYAGDEGLENAMLGRYLWTARVKVIDNDCFPSNAFSEEILSDNIHDIPNFSIYWEYLKFNWANPIVRWRTLRYMTVDQLHNLIAFMHLFINVYLVDYVLDTNSPDSKLVLVHSKYESLLLICAFTMIPFAMLHMLDHVKTRIYGVGGGSRMRLQLALLRKFLNYDNSARCRQSNGDLIMGMTRDVPVVVASGYANALNIMQEVGKLILMLAYQFIAPVVFGKRFDWLGFVPLLLTPMAMCVFLRFRSEITDDLLDARNAAQNNLVEAVGATVGNYKLIADYSQRERFVKDFESAVKDFNGKNKDTGTVLGNNEYFAKWLTVIFSIGWMLVGGLSVIDKSISLGMFLANINIFAKIGAAWGNIYHLFIEITTTYPPLEAISIAMNLPTDVSHRKQLFLHRMEETNILQKRLRSTDGGNKQLSVDRMTIKVGNLSFTYLTMSPQGSKRLTTLNQKGVLEIRQGQLVCLVGSEGGGKSTVLRILGGAILPSADLWQPQTPGQEPGEFFVPAHLRMLHISGPLFFEGTLMQNLVFGVSAGDVDSRIERVREVCTMLGATSDVLDHLEDDGVHAWAEVFSATQCQILSIARALIANPEVLCIHKPTQAVPSVATKRITGVLRDFVKERGLVQTTNNLTRRPRTVIITSADPDNIKLADQVFQVCRDNGVFRVEADMAIAALKGRIPHAAMQPMRIDRSPPPTDRDRGANGSRRRGANSGRRRNASARREGASSRSPSVPNDRRNHHPEDHRPRNPR